MSRKKQSQTEPYEHSIDKTTLVIAGFAIFILAFASLGGGKSFRAERLEPTVLGLQDTKTPQEITDEINKNFIEEYMPYLER
jgi:hypothetical protein